MSSLRESLGVPPSWTNEPVSSLQIDGSAEAVSSTLDDEPFEMLHCLPTIQSIPELSLDTEFDGGLPIAAPRPSRIPLKLDVVNLTESPSYNVPPSRRSSTTSAKAIFAPSSSDMDTIVIRRSLPSARAQVDQGLQDVISTPCLAARSHASTHEEELFQAPKITRSSFSKSSSGLSMAGAMGVAAKNRLTKHQSVRVPRRRSLIDHQGDLDPLSGESKRRLARTKSLVNRRHSKLMITPVKRLSEIPNRLSWDVMSVASTQCSSLLLASPTMEAMSLPLQSAQTEPSPTRPKPEEFLGPEGRRPKRTLSMVDSVRGFLHLFPKTPSTPASSASAQSVPLQDQTGSPSTVTAGLLRRWALGPFHRRVRSTSDVPQQRIRSLPSFWAARKDGAEVAGDGTPSSESDLGIEFVVSPTSYEKCGAASVMYPHHHHHHIIIIITSHLRRSDDRS